LLPLLLVQSSKKFVCVFAASRSAIFALNRRDFAWTGVPKYCRAIPSFLIEHDSSGFNACHRLYASFLSCRVSRSGYHGRARRSYSHRSNLKVSILDVMMLS